MITKLMVSLDRGKSMEQNTENLELALKLKQVTLVDKYKSMV